MIFVLCFFSTTFGYAQVNAIITYTYEWPKIEYKKDYQLILGDQFSNYQHHRTLSEFTTPQGYLMKFSKDYYDWYYDVTNKKIIEQRILKDGTKVIANWPADLTWNITEETKEIAGYKVQKAVTQSHDLTGRPSDWDYGDAIAWFTTEIPISSGPARYYGLPGLIVYLEFSKRSMICTLKDIKWNTNETIIIPSEGIEVTKEQTLRFSTFLNKKWLKQQKKLLEEK